MNVYVDIDETICFYESERNYELAKPNLENIKKINRLYDEGHEITYWTARGTVTKIDWYNITKNQLDTWKCKYHTLITGQKPAYDLLICDKTKRIEEI
jgi:CMP-N,N'-diacetyllegionaminic acid synthase